MAPWMNFKINQFSNYIKTNIISIEDIGVEIGPTNPDDNNSWEIKDIDGVLDLLKQVNENSIWQS
jgi:hypothetical protein